MTPELRAGVLPADARRFVAEAAPALVEAWRAAQADFAAKERDFQDRAENWQRNSGVIRRRVESPYGRALAIAEAAVAGRLEELLTQGLVTYAGHRSGDLTGDPEAIPLALLGNRRPRGSRCTVRDVQFHDLRLFRADALRGPGRPTGKTRAPRDADDRLRAWLGDVDTNQTIQEITAGLVALHPEIRAWWAESTALKRVGALLPVRANDFRP